MGPVRRDPLEIKIQKTLAEGGGKSTGFFHWMADSHFRKNALVRIKINGVWVTEDQEVIEGAASAFQSLLSDNMVWRVEINDLPFATLSSEEARSLEESFREEEVYVALNELNGDKAPSQDGFSISFRQDS